MTVPKSRLLDLLKVISYNAITIRIRTNRIQVQCRIFSMTYNPERLRIGSKILRQRLKGPSVVAYYPKKGPTLRDLRNAYPGLETWDDDEEDRLESITR